MSDLRTAAQRMLAAVEDSGHKADVTAAADDLRAALAQQDEPVWMHPWPPVRAQQAEPVDCDGCAEVCRRAVVCALCAGELTRLAQHAEPVEPVATLIAQRDALLGALKSTGLFLHHCWCDVQMNDHSFEKLNRQMEIVDAAIKAVEGEKA